VKKTQNFLPQTLSFLKVALADNAYTRIFQGLRFFNYKKFKWNKSWRLLLLSKVDVAKSKQNEYCTGDPHKTRAI